MKKEDILKIFPEITDEQYQELQKLNGQDVNPIKQDRDHYKEQLTAATEEIENFKKMDIEGIKKAADEYKTKYETAEAEHNKAMYQRDLSDALKTAAQEAGIKDLADVKGHLNMETIELKDGKLTGFTEQIEPLKEKKSYLFNGEPKITGFNPVSAPKPAGSMTKEQIMAITDPVERTKTIAQHMNLFK